MKFLQHPQHGFKHATDAEATADALNGWVDAESVELEPDPDNEQAEVQVADDHADAEPDLHPIAQPAKRGRKPKHKG